MKRILRRLAARTLMIGISLVTPAVVSADELLPGDGLYLERGEGDFLVVRGREAKAEEILTAEKPAAPATADEGKPEEEKTLQTEEKAASEPGKKAAASRTGAGPLAEDPRYTSPFLSGLRHQGTNNTCWAFAAMTACETNAKISGTDYSEKQMLYALFNGNDEEDHYLPESGNYLNEQGFSLQTAGALANEHGFGSEDKYPYNANPLSAAQLRDGSAALVSARFLPDWPDQSEDGWATVRAAVTRRIKQAVIDDGAVTVAINDKKKNSSGCYQNDYVAGEKPAVNHMVTIVGWDDEKNAFYIQNSKNAKFEWVSYDDASLSDPVSYKLSTDGTVRKNNLVLSHTRFGWSGKGIMYGGDAFSGANVFTLQSNSRISHLGFACSQAGHYALELRKTAAAAPFEGELLASASGDVSDSGYYRIALPEAVALSAKDVIAVTLHFTGTDGKTELLFEGDYFSNVSVKTDCPPQTSFVNFKGNVLDCASDFLGKDALSDFGNICIFAYGTREGVVVPPVIKDGKEAAQKKVQAAGFKNITVKEAESRTALIGEITAVSPAAGSLQDDTTPVTLTVSKGLKIPSLAGKSKSAAESALKSGGFTKVTAKEAYSATVAKGEVISVSPAAGTFQNYNASLTLTISKGKEPIPQAKFTSGKVYMLIPKAAPQLAVQSMSMVDGATLQTAKKDAGKEAQKFIFRQNSDKTWRLVSQQCALSVDAGRGSTANKAKAQLYSEDNTQSEKWKIQKNNDGSVTFLNAKTGRALDITGGSKQAGAALQMYNANNTAAQRFLLQEVSATAHGYAGTYYLKCGGNQNYALDIAGAGKTAKTNVQIYSWNQTPAQRFRLLYSGSGYYRIINVNSGMALDVAGGKSESRVNVQQYKWNGTKAQRWKPVKQADGSVVLINALGTALDVSGGKYAGKQNVWAYRQNHTKAQKWVLKKV